MLIAHLYPKGARNKMSYFRKNIDSMTPYIPGIQPKDSQVVKLNTNENPFPPTDKVLKKLTEAVGNNLRRYPDPNCDELRRLIAKTYNVDAQQVIVGNGSDEVLALIFRACVDPGDKVLLFYPTYTLYHVMAQASCAKILEHDLDDNFEIPKNAFLEKYKLSLIPNPNVPSGNFIDKSAISRLAEDSGGILVVDEAYADFAEQNCIDMIKNHDNIIVTRTFSKSFSLAGMRIGFAIASVDIISGLMKIKDSYNLNRLSLVAAQAALEDIESVNKNISQIKTIREKYAKILTELGFDVLSSSSNFLFVKPPDVLSARELYNGLLDRKILVRFFDNRRVDEYLRITIGTEQEMSRLLDNIKELLE